MRVWNLLPATIVIALIGGCITPIPVPGPGEPDPYTKSVIDDIAIGATTRSQITDQFGTPSRTFGDGRWHVYYSSKQTAPWLVVHWGNYLEVEDAYVGRARVAHFLVVEFDESDILRNATVLNENRVCNRSKTVCYHNCKLEIVDPATNKKSIYVDDYSIRFRSQE
jgi:outer membrane protein assembly factor BamE (lipoprotein component of BamABCDE complex)